MPSIRLTLVACAGATLLIGGVARVAHAQGSSGTDLANDVNISTQSGEHATANDVDTATEQDVDDSALANVDVTDGAQDTTDAGASAPATPEPTETPEPAATLEPSATPEPSAMPEPADAGTSSDSAADSTPAESPVAN